MGKAVAHRSYLRRSLGTNFRDDLVLVNDFVTEIVDNRTRLVRAKSPGTVSGRGPMRFDRSNTDLRPDYRTARA